MVTESSMMPLLMLGAHLIGDFVLQTSHMAANKLSNPRVRALHVTMYALPFAVVLLLSRLTWSRYGVLLAAIWITHFLTDSRRWCGNDPWPAKQIMVDQAIHVTTLGILGFLVGL